MNFDIPVWKHLPAYFSVKTYPYHLSNVQNLYAIPLYTGWFLRIPIVANETNPGI